MSGPQNLWDSTPELLDQHGRPYRKAIVAGEESSPEATPAKDLSRNEVHCPAFADHPCPPAAQMRWLLERHSGCVPPWRLRASAWVQARYTRELLARSLWPDATVLWDRSPVDPAKGLEFNDFDQDPK